MESTYGIRVRGPCPVVYSECVQFLRNERVCCGLAFEQPSQSRNDDLERDLAEQCRRDHSAQHSSPRSRRPRAARRLGRCFARVSPLHVVCADTSGQGFGAPKPPPPPKKKKADRAIPTAATNTNSVVSTPEWSAGGEGEQLYNAEARGRQLLEEMRQSSGETPTILKKPGMQLTEEEQRPIDPTEGVMPEEVADRMLKRIIPFAAGPVVLGVFVLIGFWFANTQMQMDLPPSIVAYATQACLLLSFAGITYGVMSTDLEEGADQSLLGAENFQKNLTICAVRRMHASPTPNTRRRWRTRCGVDYAQTGPEEHGQGGGGLAAFDLETAESVRRLRRAASQRVRVPETK